MQYTHAMLDDLRKVGDPPLDPLMPDLLADARDLAQINLLLMRYVENAQSPPEGLPEPLRQWLLEHARLPDWADSERIERASAIFVDHGLSISTMLLVSSLPDCYAAAHGAKALYATERMGYASAEKRIGETAQFVLHAMSPGALLAGGRALPVIMKVRLMHAASRYLILQSGWDNETYGVPANQEDLLGTLLVFGYTPIANLRRLGVKISDEQAEDFLYAWRVVGELLGIPTSIQPDDVENAREINALIRERTFAPSPEGVEMTAALLHALNALMPSRVFHGATHALVREMLGDEVADMLEVPRSPWSLAFRHQGVFAKAWDELQRRSTVFNNVVNRIGYRLLGAGAKYMTGYEAEFAMPAEIRSAWRLPPPRSVERVRALMPTLVEDFVEHGGSADTLLEIGTLVAQADGVVDDYEAALLAQMFEAVATSVESVPALDGNPASACAALGKALAEQRVAAQGLAVAVAVAYANSGIASEERAVVTKLAADAGVEAEHLEQIVERTRERIATALEARPVA